MKPFSLISETRIITFIVSLALFMDALDATIINTAIPAMSRSLHVNPIDLKIALISYLLSLAIFIPISGWIGDKFGIKRIFIMAIGVFTLSSIWCGYATSLPELVIARCFQGLGGSLMLPLGRLTILRTFQRHEVVQAMNSVITVVSLGLVLGPLAGGFITDHFSWHWIFWVNIPVGIVAILLSMSFLKESERRKVPPFNFVGFILFSGGLAGLTYSLSHLSETTVNQPHALMIMITSFILLITYFLLSRNRTNPIIRVDLFRYRTFRISITGNLFARLGFGGIPFLLPLLLQVALGNSAEISGLLLAPIACGIILVKMFSLRLLQIVGYKRLLLTNTILVGLCLWVFQIIGVGTSLYLVAFLTFIFGVLISLQYSGMNSIAYADLPTEDLSAATSMMSTIQQLSQSFGVAISALLLRYYSSSSINNLLTPEVFHQTFLSLGVLTIMSCVIFIGLKENDGHQMLKAPAQDKIAIH